MANESLRLWVDSFWISPYAFSCFVTLKEKKLPFEVRTASLPDKEHLKAEYQQRSLTGRVPMLEHADFSLSESSAIVEYLDEAFPGTPRALPGTARDRARARQIMAWVRSDLMPIREERPTTTMFYERATKPLSPAAEEAARRLVAFAQAVVPEARATLFGSGWSAADTDLGFMLQRLNMNGYDLPARLRKFAEAQWQLPSVQEWVKRERLPYRPY
ncbi:MAG: glutathione transferase [Myxococcales bacterium]